MKAIYVDDLGRATGSGTVGSPYGSLAHALANAPTGSTLVLRTGRYHESVQVPFYRALTIQNFPGEEVWLDGSSVLTGWTKSGSTWSVPWTYNFDSRASNSADTSRFIDPAYPMANFPEQVWVNGNKLTQVEALAKVSSSTFFVDIASKRIHIGTDPGGRTVEASTLAKGMQIQGAGTTVRGIGVRRYANSGAVGGAVTAEVSGITLENMVITDNATLGLGGWNAGKVFRKITVSNNGMLGLGMNKADGLIIEDSVFDGNNSERFKPAPVSGGVKFTASSNVRISGSVFRGNIYVGLWFDEYSTGQVVTGNTFTENTGTGLQFELAANALVVGNYMVGNIGSGMQIIDSSGIRIWNNMIAGNGAATIKMTQDTRYGSTSPYFVKSIEVRNNVLGMSSTVQCPIVFNDNTLKVLHSTLGLTFNNNVYHRTSPTAPERMVCLPYAAERQKSWRTWSEVRALGWEPNGTLLEGAVVWSDAYALQGATRTATASVPTAVPADVATLLGATTGSKTLGPVNPIVRW